MGVKRGCAYERADALTTRSLPGNLLAIPCIDLQDERVGRNSGVPRVRGSYFAVAVTSVTWSGSGICWLPKAHAHVSPPPGVLKRHLGRASGESGRHGIRTRDPRFCRTVV